MHEVLAKLEYTSIEGEVYALCIGSYAVSANVTATFTSGSSYFVNDITVSMSNGTVTCGSEEYKTELNIDGIQIVRTSNSRFIALADGDEVILIADLPTSSTDLMTGQFWNDGGVVKIKS